MARRRALEKPLLRVASRASRACLAIALGVGAASASCYSTGDGSPPPLRSFYYPVGLQVSAGGTVLYAVNSDFDLQFNGGTLQSYDLGLIRRHALALIADPTNLSIPILDRDKLGDNPCPVRSPSFPTLGETCAPPVDSSFYVRDAAIIGAFATDLLRSRTPSELIVQSSRPQGESPLCSAPAFGSSAPGCPSFGARRFDRLFTPVRGNASLTWASIERDGPDSVAPIDPAVPYGPFAIQCGKDSSGRCDIGHSAGEDPDETGNTRRLTMPGEPFGVAMSEDGESIVITHQNETKTSLFSTGLTRNDADAPGGDAAPRPFLQFVLDGVPFGGIGVTAVPHDRDAFLGSATFPRPAFFQTSRAIPEVSLIRQYPDAFGGTTPPTGSGLQRAFLDREGGFPVAIGAGGNDSRGIVVDPTPRIACKAKVRPVDTLKGRTQSDVDRDLQVCGQKPARVFIANRSPASLLVGEVGGEVTASDAYNPDRLVIHTTIPLSAGPSRLYLAPVVERDGAYSLRVFAVCFDSATVFVFNPDTEQVENVIRVGLGPFAMAFDPFDMNEVAVHAQVAYDPRAAGTGLRRYRFAYLASFTNSFVQVIDLDNAQVDRSTFERIVFTLGRPQRPKGS